jgi:hypothetical protein
LFCSAKAAAIFADAASSGLFARFWTVHAHHYFGCATLIVKSEGSLRVSILIIALGVQSGAAMATAGRDVCNPRDSGHPLSLAKWGLREPYGGVDLLWAEFVARPFKKDLLAVEDV